MRKIRKLFVAKIEKTGTGFSAYIEDGKNIIVAVGDTLTELNSELVDSLNTYLAGKGFNASSDNIRFSFDIPGFFNYYKVLNARFLAKKIRMNPTLLSKYVNGKKKPSPKQSQRIINGINEIGKELSSLVLKI